MYELFLLSPVNDSDLDTARAVLQGLAWMNAPRCFHRILFFEGGPQPRVFSSKEAVPVRPGNYSPLWSDLNRQLTRTSYTLQAWYEVFEETDFGKGTPVDLDMIPGLLKWTDFPDPQRENQNFIQRKQVEIPDHRGLLNLMKTNHHRFKSEILQESYTYIRENVEFRFFRYYVPPGFREAPAPVQALPALSEFRRNEPADMWTLEVKLRVFEDNQPEKLKKAQDELSAVRTELDRLFDFKPIDRRVFDTRVPAQAIPGR